MKLSENIKSSKKEIMAGMVILVLIVAGIYLYVDKDDKTLPEKVPAINVSELMEGDGYEDDASSIQYNDGIYMTKFEHMGIFKGYMFLNEVTFMTEENETFILMRITADINPGDDIPEAYIVPEIEDGVMAVNIYIDDDFRNSMKSGTNIIWGSEFQNFREYDFSVEYKPGIYVDTVYDNDAERFAVGGNDANVFVGDATLEDAQAMNMDGITGVFLK
ncbi:MAG: hypothetical protein KAJ56_02475 [Candidatus Aenigmarchaeota archaeon]|nr:hypothetical protein [Candidatus Aenigmarchaeota archaeon]